MPGEKGDPGEKGMTGDSGAMGRPGKTVSYNQFPSLEVQSTGCVETDLIPILCMCVLFQGLKGEKGDDGMKGDPGRMGLPGKIVRI